MEIIQVEIRNKNALTILKGLEKANIIKLITPKSKKKNSPVHHKGAFSPDRAIEMIRNMERSREEWDERTT